MRKLEVHVLTAIAAYSRQDRCDLTGTLIERIVILV